MTATSTSKFTLKQLLLTLYLPSLLLDTSQGIFLLVIPLFSLDLGVSVAGAAAVFALKGLGTLLSDVPTGFAISRFGEKPLILMSIALIAISSFAASQAESIFLLGIATLVFGIGAGVWMVARISFVTELIVLRQRGRALSSLGGVHRAGILLGPISGGLSIKYLGFEPTMMIAGMLSLIVLGLIWIVLPNPKVKHESSHSKNILKQVPIILSENKNTFLTAGVASLALMLIRAGRQLLLPLWGKHIGLDAAGIGLVYGISTAIDMSLFVVAGIVMDRYGRKWTGVPCLLFLSLSLILLPLTYNFTSLLLVALLAGFGNGLGAGIIMTLGADLAPPTGRGEFLGVWRLVGDAGGAIGPFIIALLGKFFVLGAASITTGGIGLLGAGVMAFFVRETVTKTQKKDSMFIIP